MRTVVQLLIEALGGRVQVVAHPGGGADFQALLASGAGEYVCTMLCLGSV